MMSVFTQWIPAKATNQRFLFLQQSGDPGAWRAVGPRSQEEGAGSAGEDTNTLCHRQGGSNAA